MEAGRLREVIAQGGSTVFLFENFRSRPAPKAVACVASVSVRFRSKERGTRVKDHATDGSRFISRSVKTLKSPSSVFFAPKPNGNACYREGYEGGTSFLVYSVLLDGMI